MIFFDLDETLLDFKGAERQGVKALFAAYAQQIVLTEDEFVDAWEAVGKKHFDRYLRGEVSFNGQKRARAREIFALSQIDLGDTEADAKFQIYLEGFENSWKAFDDVVPCLDQFKGCRLGIISNGDLDQQTSKLEKMGILKYFEVIVTSGDVGISKPDIRIFETACAKSGDHPEDCVYIGDHFKTDILPCGKIGMRGIWLNRKGEALSPDKAPGAEVIESLNELPALLREYCTEQKR